MDNRTQLKSQQTVQKSSGLLLPASAFLVLFLVAAVGIYAWYSLYDPCEVNAVEEASAFLVSQLTTYDHVYQVATSASRTFFDYPVNTLKQIFMDTQEFIVPACMQTAKNELINYMGTVIRAFQA